MCGVKLNERKKSEELKRTLRIGTSEFDDQKSRLRWFVMLSEKMIMTGSNVI